MSTNLENGLKGEALLQKIMKFWCISEFQVEWLIEHNLTRHERGRNEYERKIDAIQDLVEDRFEEAFAIHTAISILVLISTITFVVWVAGMILSILGIILSAKLMPLIVFSVLCFASSLIMFFAKRNLLINYFRFVKAYEEAGCSHYNMSFNVFYYSMDALSKSQPA